MARRQGWIRVQRMLLEREVWSGSTPNVKVIFVYLMLNAAYGESTIRFDGGCFDLRPGQLVTSLAAISDGTGISIQSVRTALGWLEEAGEIVQLSCRSGRIISITDTRFLGD